MLLSEYSIVTKLRLVDIDLLPPSSPLPNFTNNGDICHTSNIDTPRNSRSDDNLSSGLNLTNSSGGAR